MEFVDKMLTEVDCIILREDKLPQQPNKEDCGIFVCQYLKTLVNTDFTTVLNGLWFQGVTPHQYMREMRRDLCAHACGDLIKQLEDLGIEIPPQDEGRVTDEGAVVQERNAAMGEGRQTPVTRPVEDARVTEMMRHLTTLNNDVRYLDASFTVLANFVGLRRDEVVTAATHLLLHGGHAGTGAKAEAGGTKNAPRTPQRPSARKRRDDSSPEEDGVRNATRVALASTFAACEPTSTLLQNPHLSHGTIPHWMFTRGMHLLGAGVPAGADVWGDTRGKETVKAEEEEDLVSDTDDEEDDDEACASRYTGVKLDKASGKYGVKILIKEGGKRKQQRLGAYTTEEEGAFAYAAGAFVLRPRDKIPNTVSLSAAEKAMLRGCTKEDLQILVEARKWWRWRSWREALDSVSSKLKRGRKRGGATGTSKRHRVVDSNTMATNEPEVPDNAESGGTAPVSEQGGGAKNNEQEERGEDTDDGTGAESADSSERSEEDDEEGSDTSASASHEESADPAPEAKTNDDGCAGTAAPNADTRASQGARDTDVPRGDGRGHADGPVDRTCGNTLNPNGDDVRIPSRVLEQLIQAQDKSAKENARLEALFLNAMSRPSGGSRKRKAQKQRDPGQGPTSTMTFYPSSDDKTHGVCAVLDRLPHSFACLALAADNSRRADLNKTLSEWKTRAAARVRDIALPKLGLFRDDRDASSPWAPEKERSIEKIREHIGLGVVRPGECHEDSRWGRLRVGMLTMSVWRPLTLTVRMWCAETLVLTSWATDRNGMPFASRAFATCAKVAFRPKKAGLVMTLKVYHLAWLEHVVSDCVLYWEERKGRLSNSAGGNAHVVDGLKVLVKEAVERAIRIRNPEYDAEREAWTWGRHGLRISACGLEHMKPTAAAQSEDLVRDDDLSASVGAE
ncbi:unnamed protein product [Closterium sp. Naga37s-1]|nr:unnamed protein product [Closterium sp. Naga37s-1]